MCSYWLVVQAVFEGKISRPGNLAKGEYDAWSKKGGGFVILSYWNLDENGKKEELSIVVYIHWVSKCKNFVMVSVIKIKTIYALEIIAMCAKTISSFLPLCAETASLKRILVEGRQKCPESHKLWNDCVVSGESEIWTRHPKENFALERVFHLPNSFAQSL